MLLTKGNLDCLINYKLANSIVFDLNKQREREREGEYRRKDVIIPTEEEMLTHDRVILGTTIEMVLL